MSYFHRLTEKIVECPFDSNHKIREGALQYHIVRCMKNHPGYLTCPYNAIHRLKDVEAMKQHLKVCENKDLMLPDEMKEAFVKKHGCIEPTPIHVGNYAWNTEDEDWSKD